MNNSGLYSVDFEKIFQYTKPVYLLHGTADEMVSITYSQNLARRYHNIKFVGVPEKTHDFKLDQKMAKDVSNFLNENCCS